MLRGLPIGSPLLRLGEKVRTQPDPLIINRRTTSPLQPPRPPRSCLGPAFTPALCCTLCAGSCSFFCEGSCATGLRSSVGSRIRRDRAIRVRSCFAFSPGSGSGNPETTCRPCDGTTGRGRKVLRPEALRSSRSKSGAPHEYEGLRSVSQSRSNTSAGNRAFTSRSRPRPFRRRLCRRRGNPLPL